MQLAERPRMAEGAEDLMHCRHGCAGCSPELGLICQMCVSAHCAALAMKTASEARKTKGCTFDVRLWCRCRAGTLGLSHCDPFPCTMCHVPCIQRPA